MNIAERKELGLRRRGSRGRRLARLIGTLMIVAGLASIGWALLVWQWQDPFTLLYTKYEQRQLAKQYEKRAARFAAPDLRGRPARTTARAARADALRALARSARQYRLVVDQGEAIGRIRAPRIGLNMILVNGTDNDSLKKGPGRDERTAMPGEGELVYVAGHRTTYAAPFADIDRFRRGDRISVELPYATIVYGVTGHVIVPASDIGRLRSRGREEIALQACHPRFFATQRYIVYARPVQILSSDGRELSPAAASAAA